MRIHIGISVILVSLLCIGEVHADGPKEIGGFVLGASIDDYAGKIRMDTAISVRDLPCLKEVDILPPPGFQSGTLMFGTCAESNRILRLKMKYENPSKKFYETLLERYKDRFGDPKEWRGDPFHVVIAWKWSFTDDRNNRITMILQHNSKDAEEKMGNNVKLSLATALDIESECCQKRIGHSPEKPVQSAPEVDWDRLLPK